MKTLKHLALIFLVLAVSSSLIVPRLVAAQAPQIKIEYSRGEATAGGQKDNEFYPYKFDLCFPPGSTPE